MLAGESTSLQSHPAKSEAKAPASQTAPAGQPPTAEAAFSPRHIGPGPEETREMLRLLGLADFDALVAATVPGRIRLSRPLALPPARSEPEALADLKAIAGRNRVFRSFIGMGFYDCHTPPVIQRNVLENPGWYTPYTPYQAEISQGRLEALLNFQTMVTELTGLDIANASLLDEATACAEAMTMCHALKDGRDVFLVSDACHPQNIAVVQTRARPLGIKVVVGSADKFQFDEKVFGALVQYPDTFGAIHDFAPLAQQAHAAGALLVTAADLLALTLIKPPGEFGADIAVGSAQRFGVPMGFGGPHAAFFATRDAYKRQMPGRIVGVSKDSRGRPALRLSLQTREQHIRREKATSNICTAQALLANIASFYAVYHGPEGLKRIAEDIHRKAFIAKTVLTNAGFEYEENCFFDTLRITRAPGRLGDLTARAEAQQANLRVHADGSIGISLDETTDMQALSQLFRIFGADAGGDAERFARALDADKTTQLGSFGRFARSTKFLPHPVFNRYHSETEMMRYIKRLESRDLSLCASMIPLGSCTMKLNAAAEMFPISWPEFAKLHPFAPADQTRGYEQLFRELESWLAEITGFAAISLEPNAGSQGEYAGLLAIRGWHESRGEGRRHVCLIPTSAHGTNPASAVMAGLAVVPVACDERGNISVPDLKAKAQAHRADLAALMVTYPSTYGVFEETIVEICEIIHQHGGQVYMDGANLNAQVGLCRPGDIGADVCHLNLHKTFCIPHGGGGPGVGPIGVARHLVPFLPGNPVAPAGDKRAVGAVAAAPHGSAGILPIPWVYIAAMGAAGLTQATEMAILNANYIARRLEPYYPVLYKGDTGFVAHECILDLHQFKSVTVEDVAKRLMDYGFHAPTISWPVPGTMMVEPTESESKAELDRFCEAMIAIHAEIKAIESGEADRQNNLLKNAPHPVDVLSADQWIGPYSREQAGYPVKSLRDFKFWPAVGRIDNVYGDRNLVCSCVGMEAYT